jgi:hypothetical protein
MRRRLKGVIRRGLVFGVVIKRSSVQFVGTHFPAAGHIAPAVRAASVV